MAKRPPPRQGHPYYMHDCIRDQPEAIAKILDSQCAAADELAGLASGAREFKCAGSGRPGMRRWLGSTCSGR